MAKMFLVAAVFLAVTASSASAQAVQRGRAFTTPVASAEDYAKRIETCRTRSEMERGERSPYIYLSCEALVDSFNENPIFDEIGDMDDHRDLADYIRTLDYRLCQPNALVEIARVVGDDEVDYFERTLRDGERCLFDPNRNLYISSAVCGQWIRTKLFYNPPSFNTRVDEAIVPVQPQGDEPDGREPLADQARWQARNTELKQSGDDRNRPRESEIVRVVDGGGSFLTSKWLWIPVGIGAGAYITRGAVTGNWWLIEMTNVNRGGSGCAQTCCGTCR